MVDFHELSEKFKKYGLYKKLVNILLCNDYYQVVKTFYELSLQIISKYPLVKKSEPKNMATSRFYRKFGNNVYGEKNYNDALQLFNLALLYAPINSEEEVYAYSNRSALLSKVKRFRSALNDIDQCLSKDLSRFEGLADKLRKRREECLSMTWQETVEHNNLLGYFNDTEMSAKFFELEGERHPDFPFARNTIELIMKDGVERMVSSADIKVGEFLAIETAFVIDVLSENRLIQCYYCNAFSENLMPCDTCSHALFCSKECQAKCWEEYHEFECAMIEIYKVLPQWYTNWFKFVMKTWHLTNRNMDKFAEYSKRVDAIMQKKEGTLKLEMGNIATYFTPSGKDCVNKSGKVYNAAMYSFLVLHALKEISAEIFKTPFKLLFIEHAIKQIMFHVMHSVQMGISGACIPVDEVNEDNLCVNSLVGIGVFPFSAKMQHSCDPNVMTIGLGNKIVLVCLKPISAGTELTLAYGGSYLENNKKERQSIVYSLLDIICDCQACIGNWKRNQEEQDTMKNDIEALKALFLYDNRNSTKYKIICDILTQIKSVPTNRDHFVLNSMFRQTLAIYQYTEQKAGFNGEALKLDREELCNMMDFMKVVLNGFGR